MPHFDEYGGDTWICQVCGKIKNSLVPSVWRPDITGHKSAGNVCPDCLRIYEKKVKK
jgi:rubrerythrin